MAKKTKENIEIATVEALEPPPEPAQPTVSKPAASPQPPYKTELPALSTAQTPAMLNWPLTYGMTEKEVEAPVTTVGIMTVAPGPLLTEAWRKTPFVHKPEPPELSAHVRVRVPVIKTSTVVMVKGAKVASVQVGEVVSVEPTVRVTLLEREPPKKPSLKPA